MKQSICYKFIQQNNCYLGRYVAYLPVLCFNNHNCQLSCRANSRYFWLICSGQLDPVEYSQQARAKTASILGFFWSAVDEIVFVTEAGIDIYALTPHKKIIKVNTVLNG